MNTKNNKNSCCVRQLYETLHGLKLRILLEGILVGIISGLVVVFYRMLLGKAENFTKELYKLLTFNKIYIPLGLILLILCGYIVGVLVEKYPMISGSGIPQVEGILTGYFKVSPFKILINKFVGGVIAIGAGLSLGREGPSIQLGASCGQIVSRIFKRVELEERFLLTSGASAGLAAAFNAPFAGVIFALEEVHKNFSPLVLLAAMSASVTSDFIAKQILGGKPLFSIKGARGLKVIPVKYYPLLIILGVLLGVAGAIYNYSILKTQDMYGKIKSIRIRLVIPFIFAIIFGILCPKVLGGGNEIIYGLLKQEIVLKTAIILLLIKFIFSIISFSSGSPGGILFPLLVLGGLLGAIFGETSVMIFGISSNYVCTFTILAMAGMFTSIVRAPITGIMLICEMSGSFTHLLTVTIICTVAYLVADLLGSAPIYESLLDRQINKEKKYKKKIEEGKTFIKYVVHQGSDIENKLVRDIKIPHDALIVSIDRGAKEIIPKGDTKILRGDYILVLVNEDNKTSVREKLRDLCEKF
ncbi:ClC family H(+)/Cl(-) exchange transporter [Clostridium niameyense]|uniref:ClC family H(+)/Cl(-) exchange transporter n=1 Tax=Clostridium niameyense TaxID=1622073 RepID=UPI00311A9B8E